MAASAEVAAALATAWEGTAGLAGVGAETEAAGWGATVVRGAEAAPPLRRSRPRRAAPWEAESQAALRLLALTSTSVGAEAALRPVRLFSSISALSLWLRASRPTPLRPLAPAALGLNRAGLDGTASSASVFNYFGSVNSNAVSGPSTALDPVATSVTTPSATPTSPFLGQAVSLSATATAIDSSVITGTLAFYDGATLLGSSPINGSGTASINVSSPLSLGAHMITATFTPAADDLPPLGSTSEALTLVVTQGVASVSTPMASGTFVAGQSVGFSVSVTGLAGTPIGSVTFLDGVTSLGTVALNTGAAALSTSTLSAGPHMISVHYLGDTQYPAANSAPLSITIASAPSAVSIPTANPSSASFGEAVSLSATVTASPFSITGTIAFYDGATLLGSSAVNGTGAASIVVSTPLPVGPNSITATFTPGLSLPVAGSASQPLSFVVTQAAPSVSTPVAIGSFGGGESLTLSVAVTSAITPPTGSVTFLDNATPLGTIALNNSGAATLFVSALSAGLHTITVHYLGDSHFAAANSAPLSITIVPPTLSVSYRLCVSPSTMEPPCRPVPKHSQSRRLPIRPRSQRLRQRTG